MTEKLWEIPAETDKWRDRGRILKEGRRKQEGKGRRREAVGAGEEVIDRRCRDSD